MLLNGIIPVNKPQGFTSFDVIAKMRGILGMKKIGHSGTLDPMATGVLPVFAGNAAKAISHIEYNSKRYTAGFKLGLTTDTQDITGKVLCESGVKISMEQIIKAAEKFTGEINQLPPMYSAVSVNGKRLYEYARKGIEVEREARTVTVSHIEILDYNEFTGEGTLDVSCSGGTYVRTLIHDIGSELGCGGIMTSLVRTFSNGFSLEESVTLEQLEMLRDRNELDSAVIPVDRLFSGLPGICLSEKKTVMYKSGVKLHLDKLNGFDGHEKYRVYSDDGLFLGLAFADTANNELRVLKNMWG